MAYSPNDRGPDIPPTRSRTRSSGLWIGLIALLLVGGFLWSQSGTSPTDPTTTSSTTAPAQTQSTVPVAPEAGAPQNGATSEPAPVNPAPTQP